MIKNLFIHVVFFFFITGVGYQRIYVTFNSHKLGAFDRKSSIAAHALQMSTLYNFGASFEKGPKGKSLPRQYRNYSFSSGALELEPFLAEPPSPFWSEPVMTPKNCGISSMVLNHKSRIFLKNMSKLYLFCT